MTVTKLRELIDKAIAVDPNMEVYIRWVDDDCSHVGGSDTVEYGCTERQVFLIDGDESVEPPENYEDHDPARATPLQREEPAK